LASAKEHAYFPRVNQFALATMPTQSESHPGRGIQMIALQDVNRRHLAAKIDAKG
jgi:hypothetical protein